MASCKLNIMLNIECFGQTTNYIEVGPDKVILPENFEKYSEKIENFEVRNDDIYVLAFPKTGSRWTQELVWLLLNNLDFEQAREINLDNRSPLLELITFFDSCIPDNYLEVIDAMKGPRCIKSHLQWSILPKSIRDGIKHPKMIVMLRGPEDTCCSYYHHARSFGKYSGNFEDFCKYFLGEKFTYGPYWKHVLSSWEQRHRPNIMFLKYDEMKADLAGSIRKVAKFLERSLSDDDVAAMCDYLSFDNLKKCKGFNMEYLVNLLDTDANPYARSGTVGDHKNVMSDEMIAAFKDNRQAYLQGTGLTL